MPVLSEVGILDQVDAMALEALCTQWERAKIARRVVDEVGYFTTGSMGQIVEHPALGIERQAHSTFLRFAEQYALTPTARSRLGLAELQRRSIQDDLQETIGKRELRAVD